MGQIASSYEGGWGEEGYASFTIKFLKHMHFCHSTKYYRLRKLQVGTSHIFFYLHFAIDGTQ